ncbi:MAG: hypothetical protein HKN82_01445 [Akkermansiaceae bacterium]|nr:hypothetical protein [Akkermansiaceae bacterium]NNM28333.1 hypothetical protein [Akkermansiaceae bacterium]
MAAAALTLVLTGPLPGQLANPLPPMDDSGLEIEIEEWITIPASSTSSMQARISHLKPCPDGSRLFCNDLRGKFWVIADTDATAPAEFLDMAGHFPDFISSPGLGTGFASFAFHPEFAASGAPGYGKFFTTHVEDPSNAPGPDFAGPLNPSTRQHGVVTEWTMTNHADNALTDGPANFTRRELLRIGFPSQVHGLQEIAVDPTAVPGDPNYGCLFICVGDGGAVYVEVPGNTGRVDSALGTILRILPVLSPGQSATAYTTSANGAYFIPNTNPFLAATDPTPGDGAGVVREIYAYGFRNPHRVSWDAEGSHKMICGVIGEDNIEEIEVVEPGGHYGWPSRAGSYLFDPGDPDFVFPLPAPDTAPPSSPPAPAAYSYPAAQYDHDEGLAVVGGFVYRGSSIPELYGRYLCGDIAKGGLFVTPEDDLRLEPPAASGDAPATLRTLGLRFAGSATDLLTVLDRSRADLRFGIDHEGELYLLSKQSAKIYRVLPVPRTFVDATIEAEANSASLHFPTRVGATYRSWFSPDLRFWAISGDTTPGDGNPGVLDDAPLTGRRFFRVEELLPPSSGP